VSLYAIGAAVLAGALAVGVQTVRLASAQAEAATARQELATERMKIAIEREDAAEQRAEDEAAYRRSEDAWMRSIQEARDDADRERMDAARRAAAVAAERDRLRKSIADYADGRRTAEGAAATCDERAAKLGIVLDDALRTSAALADGAERAAADARVLFYGWPIQPVTP